jgi:uncharacterized protein (TIGR03435 family)
MNPEKNLDEILDRYITSARQEDVESHCDQVFERLQAKAETRAANPRPARSLRRWQWPAVAAIAAAIAIAVLVPTRIVQSAPAILEDGSGKRNVQYGELVRASGDMSAMLSMTNGPRVEMRSESELTLERADDGGVRIHLNKGGVIVDAGAQQTGNVYVMTKDMMASVMEAVFLVKAEEAGSRVAAIGGEVRVQQGTTETKLRSGGQVSTNPKMEWLQVKEELTWSREAVAHVALLQQGAARIPVSQTPKEEQLAFELATIRPAAPARIPAGANLRGGGGGNRANCRPEAQLDPRRFNVREVSLYELIAIAHGRCADLTQALSGGARLSGGPDWIRTDKWDIEALIAQGSVDPLPAGFMGAAGELLDGRSPKVQRMIQTLVEDRFKLALRREMKEMPVYVLTVAPGGTKFQGNDVPVRLDRDGKPLPGPVFIGAGQLPPGTDVATAIQTGQVKPLTPAEGAEVYRINFAARCNGQACRSVMFSNQFMAIPASVFAGFLGRPVLDRTGIEGKVSFSIDWPRPDAPYAPGQLPQQPSFQEIAKALEAVGLQLKEDPNGLVETFVIERAEKPSEN